jgi:hypothetical protein
VLLIQSCVEDDNAAFKEEVARTFTAENIRPHRRRRRPLSSASSTASLNSSAVGSAVGGAMGIVGGFGGGMLGNGVGGAQLPPGYRVPNSYPTTGPGMPQARVSFGSPLQGPYGGYPQAPGPGPMSRGPTQPGPPLKAQGASMPQQSAPGNMVLPSISQLAGQPGFALPASTGQLLPPRGPSTMQPQTFSTGFDGTARSAQHGPPNGSASQRPASSGPQPATSQQLHSQQVRQQQQQYPQQLARGDGPEAQLHGGARQRTASQDPTAPGASTAATSEQGRRAGLVSAPQCYLPPSTGGEWGSRVQAQHRAASNVLSVNNNGSHPASSLAPGPSSSQQMTDNRFANAPAATYGYDLNTHRTMAIQRSGAPMYHAEKKNMPGYDAANGRAPQFAPQVFNGVNPITFAMGQTAAGEAPKKQKKKKNKGDGSGVAESHAPFAGAPAAGPVVMGTSARQPTSTSGAAPGAYNSLGTDPSEGGGHTSKLASAKPTSAPPTGPAPASSSSTGASSGTGLSSKLGKPVNLDGILFQPIPPFVHPVTTVPSATSSALQQSANDLLFGSEPVFGEDAATRSTARRAVLAAGPAQPNEDKMLQMKKCLAFYFDPTEHNYELSLTVLADKFRVSHGRVKSTLQRYVACDGLFPLQRAALSEVVWVSSATARAPRLRALIDLVPWFFPTSLNCCARLHTHREIEDRIADWSDKVCAKLDEALAYYHLKNKKGQHVSLSRAADHCHVPYPHLLLWYIK